MVTGDVVGTVTDSTGSVVPGANVVIKNQGTEETRSATASTVGEFNFTLLKPGQYTVTVESKGFKSFAQSNIALSVGERYRVNARLEIGQATEKVVVTAEQAAIQTDDAQLQAVVENKAVEDLPLNGRNFVQLAQVVPGANEGPARSAASDNRGSSALVVNGQADVANNYMLDGTDNNERLLGLLGLRPSIDAIAEVNVLTGQYTAELGRTGGGVVNIITKSGSDQFHGSLYEFLRNDDFDAQPFFSVAGVKPPLKQNQFGGSIGGPIRKGKTFFFGDFEGLQQIKGAAIALTVPTLQEETTYNFNDIQVPVGPPGPNQAMGPGPDLSSQVATFDKVGLNYFKLFPKPNRSGTANNYIADPIQRQHSESFDVRVDHNISNKDALFARYSYNNTYTENPGNLPAVNGIYPDAAINSPEVVQNALGNYTHIFTPEMLLEVKAAYTRINLLTKLGNEGKNVSSDFGITGADLPGSGLGGTTGLTSVGFAGYEGLGDATFNPQTTFDSTLQYMGSLSYTKGTHSMKFGASFIKSGANQFQNRWGLGWYNFVPAGPLPTPMVALLTNQPLFLFRANLMETQEMHTSEPSVYAQDSWRITPKLTVNYGIRYSIFTPYTETHNKIESFDPTTAQLLIPGQNGVGATAGVTTDYADIAPRIGLAWSPRNGTAVHAGFGRSYYPDNTGGAIYLKNQPIEYTYSAFFFSPQPASLDSMPEPTVEKTDQASLAGALSGVDKDFKASYADQFSLNVQQDVRGYVANVGYVGVTTHRQSMDLQINTAAPSDPTHTLAYASVLPNITNGISYQVTHGSSNYNALQASVQRQYSTGLMLNLNYTWAHALSDVLSYTGRGLSEGWGEVENPAPWYNIYKQVKRREYGNSDFDIRHRIAMQLTYAIPFGHNLHGAEGLALKGWHASSIFVWQTGEPFSVITSNTGVTNTEINPPNNGSRTDWTGKWKISNPSIDKWFDTSAFSTSQISGRLGNEPRNALFGPHFRHFDFSVNKDFKLTESTSLQFRAESFNLTNTPNFDLPANDITAGNFGTISNTRSDPRQIQLALKLTF
jgi:hypothetical protein